jgi:glucose-1-phosphate adenylyltransferase
MVLAGGEGTRLLPLTRERAKAALPFGGNYRLIDCPLSNLVNGGYLRIAVLTQYKSHSLDRHIAQTWNLSPLLDDYVASVPAQMRLGRRWFEGSADAIYQNLNLLGDENPDYVVVLGADHIYRMDPQQFVAAHIESGAGVTVAAIRVPREEASRFGVLLPGPNHKILKFVEKPPHVDGLSDNPHQVFASMGNYVFTRKALEEAVRADADNVDSAHDMGGDIIATLVNAGNAAVYDFADNVVPGATDRDREHWCDVGTLDLYHEAHMDLVSVHPVFNLYDRQWPIHSRALSLPPAKFVLDDPNSPGMAVDSVVSEGVVICGGTVRRSVLASGVKVDRQALVEDSVLMQDVEIGRGALVRRAIIDKNVRVPPGVHIGVDREEDRARGLTISAGGVVVIGKGDVVIEFPSLARDRGISALAV